MEIKSDESLVYTVSEVAKILKVNKNTVYRLINSGYLTSMKLGSKKITHMALLNFLQKYEGFDFKHLNDSNS